MEIKDTVTAFAKTILPRANDSHIQGLFHETSLGNIVKILASGWLYTSAEFGFLHPTVELEGLTVSKGDEWKDGGQFQGVYMRPYFDFLEGTQMLPKKQKDKHNPSPFDPKYSKIALVFTTLLLEREDYHVSLNDQNGYYTENSYLPSMMDMVGQHRKDHPLTFAEVVFHRRISTAYLNKIWVLAQTQQEYNARYAELLDAFGGKNTTEAKKWMPLVEPWSNNQFPKTVYNLGCDDMPLVESVRQSSFGPLYCSAFPGEITDSVNPLALANLSTLKFVAATCDISNDEIKQLIGQDQGNDSHFRALRDAIHEKEVEQVSKDVKQRLGKKNGGTAKNKKTCSFHIGKKIASRN